MKEFNTTFLEKLKKEQGKSILDLRIPQMTPDTFAGRLQIGPITLFSGKL